jgi:hypothetical protein
MTDLFLPVSWGSRHRQYPRQSSDRPGRSRPRSKRRNFNFSLNI